MSMTMTEGKKRQVKVGSIGGAILGVALFAVFWVASNYNILTVAIIPAAILIGAGQGYLSPAPDEKDKE